MPQTSCGYSFVFALWYPVMIFACVSLPTWWSGLTKSTIQSYQQDRPDKLFGHYWATALGSHLVLKLFPDILLYYGAIYLVSVVAFTAQYVPALRSVLHSRWKFLAGYSIGEFSLVILLIALLISDFLYWYFEHGWQLTAVSAYTRAERGARSTGQVANLVAGLLLLPVSRNSVLEQGAGCVLGGADQVPSVPGGLLLMLIVSHAFLWWKVFAEQGTFPHDIFAGS